MTPYYEDDAVTLWLGDCETILPTLSGVDCVVTSPPYNTLGSRIPAKPTGYMAQKPGWFAKVAALGYEDERTEAEYEAWQVSVARALAAACRPGASFFYNHKVRYRDGAPVHPLDLVRQFDPWTVRQEIVWARDGGMAFNARMFCPSDERIYWLVNPGADHGWNQPSASDMTVWRMRQEIGIDGHPCPYPTQLPTRCIAAVTQPGDVVMDPFVGSGTTAVAAKALGRRCIGIDKSAAYLDLAIDRLRQGVLDFGAVS